MSANGYPPVFFSHASVGAPVNASAAAFVVVLYLILVSEPVPKAAATRAALDRATKGTLLHAAAQRMRGDAMERRAAFPGADTEVKGSA